MKRALRIFGWLYLSALAIAIAANVLIGLTTQYGDRTTVGCNLYDAMVIGVECRGFAGYKAIELLLNWPFWLLYGPMFAFGSPLLLPVSVLLWTPLAYLVFTYTRRSIAT